MATYYIDFISGLETNTGTTVGSPLKYDPDMSVATKGITLADDDIIEYLGDTGSSVEWLLPSGAGIDVRAAINGITRRTRAGDFPVIFDFRVYPTSTDWSDEGGNVWKCQLQLTTTAYAKRFFIEDVSPNLVVPIGVETEAATVARLSATTPVFMTDVGTQNSIYMYSEGNPETVYGVGNLSFVRASGAINGFYFGNGAYATPVESHVVDNVISRGAATPFAIHAYHNDIVIQNCRSEMWGRHGMQSSADAPWADVSAKQLPYVGVPNRHVVFDSCVSDMVTQIDEWPNDQGERGGDSFAINGPHVGGRIINCHSQDNHHTAFQVQGYNTWANDGITDPNRGYTHGVIACEIGWCTADNRNSFYGRLIGSVGSKEIGTYSYNNAYGIIHHNSGTNMKTRSQISGDNLRVYNNNFSNVIGTRTQYGTDYPGETRSGEGLRMDSSQDTDGTGFGSKSVTDCEVFNNTFAYNRLAGLRVSHGWTGKDADNVFRDNVFLNNNEQVADETDAWQYHQIMISGTPVTTNLYKDNFMQGGTQEVVGLGSGAATETVTEFDATAYASGNSNTVTRVDGDGIPRTAANTQSGGTLPSIPPANLVTGTDPNDIITGTKWYAFNRGPPVGDGTDTTPDKYGYTTALNYTSAYHATANAVTYPAAVTLTLSVLAGCRPEMELESLEDALLLRGRYETTITIGANVVPSETTMVFEQATFVNPNTGSEDKNWFYFTAWANRYVEPNFGINLSYVRVAIESTAPLPLADQYTQWDLSTTWGGEAPRAGYDKTDQTSLGDTNSSNDYVGAYYTITAPVVPNIVDDYHGNRLTEAQASARLANYFFTDGIVTYAGSPTVASGDVISQGTDAGTTGAINDQVNYVVSVGSVGGGVTTNRRRNRR